MVPSTPLKADQPRADVDGVTSPVRLDAFASWLGSPVIRVSLRRSHGQWYAVARDFGIAGVGRSQADAYRDVLRLVEAYLQAVFADGRPYTDAMRPMPNGRPLRAFITSVHRGLMRAQSRIAPGREREVVLPSALRRVGPTP
jgi:hypothetical protein